MATQYQEIKNKIEYRVRKYSPPFKYIRVMSMIYLSLLLASTITAYRVVEIGSISGPGSTLIYATSFFWLNIITEVYGTEQTKRMIWEALICGYIFAILLYTINLLPAPDFWNNKEAYQQVTGHILRFTNVGVVGYITSAYVNVYLLNHWKHKMHGKLFWVRSLLASSISEGIATFGVGIMTFFGMMPLNNVMTIMTNALIFKLVYGFVAIGPASFIAFVLKKEEVNNL